MGAPYQSGPEEVSLSITEEQLHPLPKGSAGLPPHFLTFLQNSFSLTTILSLIRVKGLIPIAPGLVPGEKPRQYSKQELLLVENERGYGGSK